MDPKWHIAYCNVTVTECVGMTYRDYYGSPARMLEAQLQAAAMVEKRFGVGRFIRPHIDSPPVTLASFLGMPVVVPEADELPYVDGSRPVITDPTAWASLRVGDPRTDGLMAARWDAWQYYTARGYKVRVGGYGGAVVTVACEISGNEILLWLAESPAAGRRILDFVVTAHEALARFDDSVSGVGTGGYVGDDFSGLLSPEMFRRFAIPCYEKLYAGKTSRFMHSELLRAEHLRIVRDTLHITSFHGAGAKNLTLAEMHEIMGHDFWAQLTPQEMLELSPNAIAERIREFADSGAGYVQLYPGRGTPVRNLEAAIAAVRRECPGGPCW